MFWFEFGEYKHWHAILFILAVQISINHLIHGILRASQECVFEYFETIAKFKNDSFQFLGTIWYFQNTIWNSL